MPLLGCALAAALLGGTAAGLLTGVRAGDAFGGVVAIITISVLASSASARRIGCAIAIAMAGVAVGARARDQAIRPPLLPWFEAQPGTGRSFGTVMIDGRLLTDASRSDSGVRLFVDVTRPAAGRLVVHVGGTLGAERLREWTAGRRVRFPATLRRPQMLRNFG